MLVAAHRLNRQPEAYVQLPNEILLMFCAGDVADSAVCLSLWPRQERRNGFTFPVGHLVICGDAGLVFGL